MKHEKMRHSEITDQRDLVLGCRQQMRGVVRPQDFYRVRIERDHDRCPAGFCRMSCGGRDHSLVSEMNTVENADGEEKRTGEGSELRDRAQDFHENDE